MKYETIPIVVEAHQQQFVSARVPTGDPTGPCGFTTANPGDWIVKWPDGRLEVYSDKDFNAKFRKPPPTPYVGIRQPLTEREKWPFDRPKITWEQPNHPIINPDITCGGTPCSPQV